MPQNTYGRQVVEALVNKSGGAVAAGDVVIIDTANDGAFTTTTTARAEITIGVVQETIASNATGRVLLSGYAALVNVPASVTRGHYVETHTVAKQATGNSARRSGSFGQFRTGGTTPTAVLWGSSDQTASGGGSLTVEEVDGSPTDSAVTKIVFPNSTLAIASHVATYTPSGGGGSLSYLQSFLAADVMFAAATTFYDGPTVTLSAGTWWLSGRLMLLDPTGGSGIYSLKLWDGTTVATNYQASGPATGAWLNPAPLQAVVVVASGTPVWKVSAAWQGGAGANLIKAAGTTNISGNVASVMTAIKIA